MAKTNNHLVIMAGGVGSRFWPMSTAENPKQFIDVLGIGKKRYKKVAPELTRMINEIRVDDPIRAEKQIKEAFERMK